MLRRNLAELLVVLGNAGVDADTLLGEQVDEERVRLVALAGGEDRLRVLVGLDAVDVLVEQVGRVERAALGLRVELRAEDGAGLVDHALVGAVVEVDEVLLPLAGHRGGVHGVTVVLRGDVALAGGEVKGRDVVGAVAVLHLDGAGTGSKGEELVTHANTHDGDLAGLNELAEVVDGVLAVSWVTGTVGDEDTIEVVSNLVDRVVVGERSDAGATANKATKDVLLDTTVDQSDVHVAEVRADMEGLLGAHTADKVDTLRVNVGFVLIGIVLFTNGDPGERGTLFTEVGDNGAGVDARDGRNALPLTPLGQALDGGPVAVLLGDIGNDDTRGLDVGRLEVPKQAELITDRRRNAIVADQGLGEDKNLATVGGVGHGLGVADEGSGEDSLAGDVLLSTE